MKARFITVLALIATSLGWVASAAWARPPGPEGGAPRSGAPVPSGPAVSEVQAAAPGGQLILKTAGDDWRPVVTKGFLLWTANTTEHRGHYDVYARPFGKQPFKVNIGSTEAWLGDVDGTRVVYQTRSGRQSDIKFFDLSTKVTSNPPAGVNTRAWEWQPSVSGDWLLFNREVGGYRGTWVIILLNLETGEKRVLASMKHRGSWFMKAVQVNGNYAVWYRGRFTKGGDSDVYVYDIEAKRTKQITDAHWEYAPSVSADGTVYFNRWDGKSTLWLSRKGDWSRRMILHLAPDYDVSNTYPFTNSDATYLYYDPYSTLDGAFSGDIYRVKVTT